MKIKFLDGTEKEFETLRDANLQSADLRGADLQSANLRDAEGLIYIANGYKYESLLYEYKNVIYIRLGCHTRTLKDWKVDFWNNPNEFPNINSYESLRRINTFNYLAAQASILFPEST